MTTTLTQPRETAPATAGSARGARAAARSKRLIARLLCVVVALALWEGAVRTGVLPRTSVPTATGTLSALGDLVTTSAFWDTLGQTAYGWGLGLLLCCAFGIPAGLLIGSSRALIRSTRLVIDFLRTIPAVALIPVLLLTLGSTTTMKLNLIVFGAVWPVLTSTLDGVRHTDPVAADTIRTFRLSPLARLRHLVLPSALPFVVTGLKTSAVVALMLTTAAEYLGSAPGIGKALGTAQQAGAIDAMFAWLAVAGLLGVALNTVLQAAESRALSWTPAYREGAASR